MKKITWTFLFVICWCIGFQPKLFGQIISEQSKVTFKVSHVGGTVEGAITGMQGTVNFDENNLPGSSMAATVESKTVDTDNNARDSDLRKNKFFDSDSYPQIKFQSREITRSGDGFQVAGDLTIKDKTRPEVIPFHREVKGREEIYTGSFTLNRKDYNLGKSVFPPIGKEVKVTILAVVRK